ncbi:MAG: recombination mediator RecR [Rickettsiaceae bacterium]|nr:recombination mediator RecR [Rickettsiaceae bacterium]
MQNNVIENLIYIFSKLPGLGPRSARRIVLHLLEDKKHRMGLLASTLNDASEKIEECIYCYNIDHISPCGICANKSRDNSVIAVVENIADLWALERSGSFNGLFHVLGSGLGSFGGKKSEDLKLDKLKKRIKEVGAKEIIIATSTTLDGQTIAYYITEFFKSSGINITRIASGIPIGGELDYLDEGTLTAALKSRTPF